MARPRSLPTVLAMLAGGLLATATPAAADLIRWVDGEGVVRYVTSRRLVPGAYRGAAQAVRPGMADVPVADAEPEPAAPAPATPGGSLPSVIGAPVPDPSLSLGNAGLPAPGPTAVAEAAPEAETPATREPQGKDLGTRIRELEDAISRDEETLKDLISTPPAEGEEGIERSATLREIARRLPGMQAELRALKQRQAVEGP